MYILLHLQVLAMSPHEIEWVCNHLGHTEAVHKTHYRATSSLVERIDVSKIILLQEKNLVGKYAGKKLSEIQFSGMLQLINHVLT